MNAVVKSVPKGMKCTVVPGAEISLGAVAVEGAIVTVGAPKRDGAPSSASDTAALKDSGAANIPARVVVHAERAKIVGSTFSGPIDVISAGAADNNTFLNGARALPPTPEISPLAALEQMKASPGRDFRGARDLDPRAFSPFLTDQETKAVLVLLEKDRPEVSAAGAQLLGSIRNVEPGGYGHKAKASALVDALEYAVRESKTRSGMEMALTVLTTVPEYLGQAGQKAIPALEALLQGGMGYEEKDRIAKTMVRLDRSMARYSFRKIIMEGAQAGQVPDSSVKCAIKSISALFPERRVESGIGAIDKDLGLAVMRVVQREHENGKYDTKAALELISKISGKEANLFFLGLIGRGGPAVLEPAIKHLKDFGETRHLDVLRDVAKSRLSAPIVHEAISAVTSRCTGWVEPLWQRAVNWWHGVGSSAAVE